MIETRHTTELPLGDILIPVDRAINPEKLHQLVASIQEKGLISPIAITDKHELISGFHRLKAFEVLAHTDPLRYGRIPVRIFNQNDHHQLQQLEITEKLFNPCLSILDKAEAFKHYFDALKYGNTRYKTTQIFKTLDISRRTFFNLRAIAEGLSAEVRQHIRTLPNVQLAQSMAQLLALTRYEESIQLRLLERMRTQNLLTIFEAIRQEEAQGENLNRKRQRKNRKSPSLKLDRELHRALLQLSRQTGRGQNELFNAIFEAGLEVFRRSQSS